jgi:hypothetical protein
MPLGALAIRDNRANGGIYGNPSLGNLPTLCHCSSLQAQPQTATGTQRAKTTAATPKSKALLAAEKRIAELEAEVEDRDKKLAELEPLKKTMANIAAAAVPGSRIAPTDTVARNRAVLFVDPSGALLWHARGSDGTYFLAALNASACPDRRVALRQGQIHFPYHVRLRQHLAKFVAAAGSTRANAGRSGLRWLRGLRITLGEFASRYMNVTHGSWVSLPATKNFGAVRAKSPKSRETQITTIFFSLCLLFRLPPRHTTSIRIPKLS